MDLGESPLWGWRCLTRHVMLSSHGSRARADHDSSRQAIQKYIKANNNVGNLSDTAFKGHVNRAIAHGVEKGIFLQPKGKCLPVP
jgi:hypothetical protein